MRSHLTVRALIYGVAFVAAAVAVLAGLAIYRNGVTIPGSVLNWPVAQRVAARYGARYGLDSLRIGCLTKSCPGEVNAGAFNVELNTGEPFRVRLNSAAWRRAAPVTVNGLEVRSGDREPLITAESLNANPSSSRVEATGIRVQLSPGVPPSEIDRVEFDGAAKRVAVNRILVERAGRSPVIVEQIQLAGWNITDPGREVVLDRVDVGAVNLNLDRGTADATFCELLQPSNAAGGRDEAPLLPPLLPFLNGSLRILQADLLRAALILGGVLLILKFLLVLWLRGWAARLLVTPLPVLLVFGLYFSFRETWTTGRLVWAVAATVAAVAVLLRLLVYRRGAKWHQRWEPFAADLASIVILLPLLGYGYRLPVMPAAPQKFRLDRLEVATIAGRSDGGAQFDIPRAVVLGARLSLPDSVRKVADLTVSAIEVPTAAIAVNPASRLTLDETRVDGVIAAYDSDRMQIRDVYAHVRLAGLFESDALQRELRHLEYLQGMEPRSTRVNFALDLTAAGPVTAPQIPQQFPQSGHPLAVNAAVTLKPADCTAAYDVSARILTDSVRLAARADGDAQQVNIRTLRSLPGSSLQIESGSGSVALSGEPRLQLDMGAIGGAVGSAQLSLSSLGITAALPRRGQPGRQSMALALGPAEIQSADGMQIRFAGAGVQLDREPNPSGIPVRFHTRVDDVRVDRRNNGILEADFPVLEAAIEGKTTPESIPNTFTGTATFRMSGAGATGELLGLERPLSVSLDLWKGRLEVPEQPLILRGDLLAQSTSNIPLLVGLSGQLSSLEPQVAASLRAHAGIDRIEQALGSGLAVAQDIRLDGNAAWDDRGVSARVNYATGWIDAVIPPPPSFALCLDEISTLDLTVAGKASRIPSFGGTEAKPADPPSTCASISSVSREARFRLSGVYPPSSQEPLLRLENASGTGIRVGTIGSELRVLRIRAGRIGETESRITATGIQNLQGLGGLDVLADIRRDGESLAVTAGILASGGARLLEAAVTRSPERLTLDATQDMPADRILDRLRPFWSGLNPDLDGISPHARVARLHAEAIFENGALGEASAAAEFAGGPLVSIDRPDLRMSVSTPSTGAGPGFRLSIGRLPQPGAARSITALVDLPVSAINATTTDGSVLSAETKLRIDLRGSLLETGRPPASPILEKIFDVREGLSREVSRLAGIFGSETATAPATNIEWDLHFSQRSPMRPLVRFSPDAIRADGPRVSFSAGWDGGNASERSKVAGSSDFDTTLALSGDALVLEALPSVQLALMLDGEPETRFASNLPIQVAFSRSLKQAPAPGDSLWDGEYYTSFWRSHPSGFSGTEIASPVDITQASLGGLSIRQVLFPSEPLRAIVGYSDALQIGLPLAGRALFGAVAGQLEASLAPVAEAASLDMRLKVDLKGIQLGALGSTLGGGHSAFVEDELDGETSFRLDGITLDRNTVAAFRAGKPAPDELRKIGLSVRLRRSPETANIPAVLQASTDVEINLANQLLNDIVKGLRLSAPPRALTYRDLDVNFEVDRGLVRSDREILRLGGLQILSTDTVDIEGQVRAHLGRQGERILLRDMIEMLGALVPAAEAEAQ